MSEVRVRQTRILVGDVLERLASVPAESVHCVGTSPPFWGLRDYGIPPTAWPAVTFVPVAGLPTMTVEPMTCCLGLESDPWAFVGHMVAVFREVRRVLRSDGVCWVNMGDSYVGGPSGPQGKSGDRADRTFTAKTIDNTARANGRQPKAESRRLKQKDLVGVPWRLALALQADGWYLRADLPWVKRSAMPESVTDRPAKAIEYIFLLTKSPRYFFDLEAVRKPAAPATRSRDKYSRKLADDGPQAVRHDHETICPEAGRQMRNADLYFESLRAPHGFVCVGDEPVGLDVTPQAYSEAHFATFPEALVRPLILAGTSEKGCCAECGAPVRRVVEKEATGETQKMADGWDADPGGHSSVHRNGRSKGEGGVPVMRSTTTGWEPTCACFGKFYDREYAQDENLDPDRTKRTRKVYRSGKHPPWQPCVVLDPFLGSGTTAKVANELGRAAIGIELSPEYVELAVKRIADAKRHAIAPPVKDVAGQVKLFG